MMGLRKHSLQVDRTDDYATNEDVCQIFTENMDSLYLLSLLLTGDHQKAQQCFVASLENSISAKVFKNWARAWAVLPQLETQFPRPNKLIPTYAPLSRDRVDFVSRRACERRTGYCEHHQDVFGAEPHRRRNSLQDRQTGGPVA